MRSRNEVGTKEYKNECISRCIFLDILSLSVEPNLDSVIGISMWLL